MAESEEHSSQFIYHWMGAIASSQDVVDTEPMDVHPEVRQLVCVLALICIVCLMYEPPVSFSVFSTLKELQVVSVVF